jgi:hypothetical protein
MRLLAFALAACSSSTAPPAQPATSPEAPADAAVEPVVIDAPPDLSTSAPAYVFRFASAARTETWTLWFASGAAMLDVQPATGTAIRYHGTATDGASVVIEVATATAKMKLDCKRAKRELDPPCVTPKPKKKPAKITVDALDCFHADFTEPMPFGPSPGIEYVADGACAGYRVVAPGP